MILKSLCGYDAVHDGFGETELSGNKRQGVSGASFHRLGDLWAARAFHSNPFQLSSSHSLR
jgi:hypothetical protein